MELEKKELSPWILRLAKIKKSDFENYINGINTGVFSQMIDTRQFALSWLSIKLADNKLNQEASFEEINQVYTDSIKDKSNEDLIILGEPYFKKENEANAK